MLVLLFLLMLPSLLRGDDGETTGTLRIVTAAPNLTEIVFALGGGDQVVGISRFTEFPPEAMHLPQVTDLLNPNIEGILALRPTMLIVLPGQKALQEFFGKRKDVRLVTVSRLESFDELVEVIRHLGHELHREEAAEELAAGIEKELAVRRAAAPEHRERVLLVIGGPGEGPHNLVAAGRGTYLDEMLAMAGFENALPESMGIYPTLGSEGLLTVNPERILFFSGKVPEGEERQRMRLKWEALKTLRALRREDGFAWLTEMSLLVPGPRAIEGVDRIREALAPAEVLAP